MCGPFSRDLRQAPAALLQHIQQQQHQALQSNETAPSVAIHKPLAFCELSVGFDSIQSNLPFGLPEVSLLW